MEEEYINKAGIRGQQSSTFLQFVNEVDIEENKPRVEELNKAFLESTSQSKEPEEVILEEKPEEEVADESLLMQAGGGVIDATNEFLQATEEFSDWLQTETIFPDLGQIQLYNEKGELDLDYISTQEKIEKGIEGVSLPTVKAPTSTTGSIVRGLSQFVTGFIPAMKATKVMSGATTASKVKRAVAAGALTDFTFFDPHEERLADLLRDNFELRDPVTKYLAADKLDGNLEGRFKNVLEGLGIDAVTAGAFSSILKGYRAVRSVRKLPKD